MNDTKPATKADFVEHSHPDFGSGYFCTSDVFQRIAELEAAQAVPVDGFKPLQGLSAYLRCEAQSLIYGSEAHTTLLQWAKEADSTQAVPVQAIPDLDATTTNTLATNEINRLVKENFGRFPQGDWADKVLSVRDLCEKLLRLSAAPTPPQKVASLTDAQVQAMSDQHQREEFAEWTAEESAADYKTIMGMGRLLARIAIAVKGEEQAKKRHGYADLPELVEKMAIELEVYRAAPSPQAEPPQLTMSMFASKDDLDAARAEQAGVVGWWCSELNQIRWRAGILNCHLVDGQPFYTQLTQDAGSQRDPQEARVMLQCLQAGEMTVSRAMELLRIWLAGNYKDDMVPSPPDDSALITDDKFPMELVRELRAKLAALQPIPQADPKPDEVKIEIYGPATANWIQHNNKGVRITHIPTGAVAECDTERSQHANRDIAYKALLAKLRATQPTQDADSLTVPITATDEITCAIEAMVDQQLVASAIEPIQMFRQDGSRIWDAAIAAIQAKGEQA